MVATKIYAGVLGKWNISGSNDFLNHYWLLSA